MSKLTFLCIWIFVMFVGICAFLWALDATVMARFDRVEDGHSYGSMQPRGEVRI